MKYDRILVERVQGRLVVDDDTGCHLWTGAVNSAGYGVLLYLYKSYKPHRVMMNAQEGDIICHKCDTPLCCNPDHLYKGTRSQNAYDVIKRTGHGCATLTVNQVIEIKRLLAAGVKGCEIAKLFNVKPPAISRIKTGKRWKHIEEQL